LSLKIRITALALLVAVIPLTIFQIISAKRSTDTIIASVASQLESQSKLITNAINGVISQRINKTKLVAQSDVFKVWDYQKIKDYIQLLTKFNTSIDAINVINEKGIIVVSSVDPKQEGYLAWDVNLGIKELFVSALQTHTNSVFISEAHLIGPIPELLFVTHIPNNAPDSKSENVLLVKFNLIAINQVVQSFGQHNLGGKQTHIVDKLGKIILTTNANMALFETLPDVRVQPALLADSRSGSASYTKPDDVSVLAGYTDLSGSGANNALDWSVITTTPVAEILKPAAETRNVLTMIGIVVCSIAVLIAYLFAESISLPLQETAALAEEIRSGNYTHRLSANISGELGTLATAFNEMADRVEERTAEIVQRNEKLTSEIVERTRTEDRLKLLSHKIVRMQEEERRRVARELHDGINQLLVSVKYKVESFADNFTQSGETALSDVKKALSFLEEAISEVRRISHDLRPSVLDDLGLSPAISNLTRQFSERNQIDVIIEDSDSDTFDRLPVDVETAMYRIVQEALTNIEKHANASKVVIHMTHTDKDVTIRIEDDGEGFNIQKATRTTKTSQSMGLRNMRERIELLQGTFFMHSDVGKGTFLEVKAPLKLE